ncbi:MAG: hypothetical protein QW096_09260 [Thermofilaceae archaeon]
MWIVIILAIFIYNRASGKAFYKNVELHTIIKVLREAVLKKFNPEIIKRKLIMVLSAE